MPNVYMYVVKKKYMLWRKIGKIYSQVDGGLYAPMMPLLLLHKGIMAAYVDPQGIFKTLSVHFSFILVGEMLILCS